ncbi:MAG: CdiA family toxin C-terminal domain-containing protein [Coriobacteriales bacterium]|jgi:hypothetical protein|nr:CdiA family toxin C-terminal domain-containing protein [Coriobacteriales bacterium]
MSNGLRINFSTLQGVASALGSYLRELDTLEAAIKEFDSLLASSEDGSVEELRLSELGVFSAIDADRTQAVKAKELMMAYIDEMASAIKPSLVGNPCRAESISAYWSIQQIEEVVGMPMPSRPLDKQAGPEASEQAKGHDHPVDALIDERAKLLKTELGGFIEEMWCLHHKARRLEETDKKYAEHAIKLCEDFVARKTIEPFARQETFEAVRHLDMIDVPSALDHLVGTSARVTRYGIFGCHNANSFNALLRSFGALPEDCIVSCRPHPSIVGVTDITYQVPRRRSDLTIQEPLALRPAKSQKTLYDPTVISDRQMFEWGAQAMRGTPPALNGTIKGTASNGLDFIGYTNSAGKIACLSPVCQHKAVTKHDD